MLSRRKYEYRKNRRLKEKAYIFQVNNADEGNGIKQEVHEHMVCIKNKKK